MVRNFKKEPVTEQEVIYCYWYPVVDNLIGGWAISNVDMTTADLNPYEGKFELGSFMTEAQARHIADIHNTWYQDLVWKQDYYQNYLVSMYNNSIRDIIEFNDDPEEIEYYRTKLVECYEDLPY